MIINYLKTACRNIIRNKVYTLINIFGLTVGLTAVLLISLYVYNEFQYDRFLTNRSRIFRLESSFNNAEVPSLPGHVLMQENSYCEKVARVNIHDNNLTYKNIGYFVKNFALADSSFFDIFNFEFLTGNSKDALKDLNSLVLTESLAKTIFGKENPIGKLVLYENKFPFTITGVIKDPVYFHLPFSCIGTLESLKKIDNDKVLMKFDGWDYFTYILGKKGFSDAEIQKKVNDKLMEYDYKYFVKFNLTSLNNLYLNNPLTYESPTIHGNKPLINILISIAILILIIACINFINIATARASVRAKEIGIRKTIGASRKQLIVQFIIETMIIIIVSLILALTFIQLIQPYFCNLVGKKIDFSIIYSYGFISVIIGFSILIGCIAGLYPSFYLSRYKPAIVLKGKLPHQTNSSFLKNGLIVFQYIIAIALITGTLVIYKQLVYLKNMNLGFNKDHLVYVKINDEIIKQQDLFKSEILNIPGVKRASYSGNIMGAEWGNWQNDIGEIRRLNFKMNFIDHDYFETMGIKVSEGRNFRDDASDVNSNFIINEQAVKQYDLQNIIGTPVIREGRYGSVIGVVKDIHYLSPRDKILPTLFYYTKKHLRYLNLKIDAANIPLTLKKIKKVWDTTCPAFAFEFQFADATYDRQYRSDEMMGFMIGIGSLLAIVIACMGIVGLAVSSSENRTKEIGVRKVNGAKISQILFLLNEGFLKLVLISFIITCPIIWYASYKWLQGFANKIEISWWMFVLSGFVALFIALVAISWQTWQAARKNPIESLRYE